VPTHIIPPCTMGCSTPKDSVKRVRIKSFSQSAAAAFFYRLFGKGVAGPIIALRPT
jgi:hypothetical protein